MRNLKAVFLVILFSTQAFADAKSANWEAAANVAGKSSKSNANPAIATQNACADAIDKAASSCPRKCQDFCQAKTPKQNACSSHIEPNDAANLPDAPPATSGPRKTVKAGTPNRQGVIKVECAVTDIACQCVCCPAPTNANAAFESSDDELRQNIIDFCANSLADMGAYQLEEESLASPSALDSVPEARSIVPQNGEFRQVSPVLPNRVP